MKVAFVHYWLVGMRGGERVLEELIRLYPDADIYTHVAIPDQLSKTITERPITETFIARLPMARTHYQKYLSFMPRALEDLDLSGYDLVISSESGPAKGVVVPPDTAHICYVHSPMRYIWDQYPSYSATLGPVFKAYFSRLAHRLRIWDVTTAARVDHFVANSSFVAQRIWRYYHRHADVVHPPVDLERYNLPSTFKARKHYLFVSQLVPYKRADLAIEAFRGLEQTLLVVGDGSQRKDLERDLPPNVHLLGKVLAAELPALYQGARALIFPVEEDFGIVPVEAMASGTPVLAYGRGGVLDSVVDGQTGLFFEEQTPQAIRDVVAKFEQQADRFDPHVLREHAKRFAAERFRQAFAKVVEQVMDTQSGTTKRVTADGRSELE